MARIGPLKNPNVRGRRRSAVHKSGAGNSWKRPPTHERRRSVAHNRKSRSCVKNSRWRKLRTTRDARGALGVSALSLLKSPSSACAAHWRRLSARSVGPRMR